jgi:UDP-N-acetylmuramate: L-alanyl-gamma-D-glutamyl-meso-diaminopimelate ligase
VVKHKNLDPISEEEIKNAFQRQNIQFFTDSDKLFKTLSEKKFENSLLLIMSSGSFNGTNIKSFADQILATNS